MVGILGGCEATTQSGDSAPRDGSAASSDPAGGICFTHGYAQGYREAQAAGKPMLVFFSARWCHYCHEMLREAFTDLRVARLSRQFVCVLVDADVEPEVCREFQVEGFPTVQFISGRGVPLNRLIGKTPGPTLALQMQAALEATAARDRPPGQPARR
jgi:thiol-disulfide isomerase/thioredoxin